MNRPAERRSGTVQGGPAGRFGRLSLAEAAAISRASPAPLRWDFF